MDSHSNYFEYLKTRSKVAWIYRKYYLYPKIYKNLKGKILDVGCGIGDMLYCYNDIIGTDISWPCVHYCKSKGLKAEIMEPDSLPFCPEEFDSCLLDNVIEHLEKPLTLLMEIKRVLKDGGIFIIGIPGVKGWNSDPDHKIFYTEKNLIDLMEKHGFKFSHSFGVPFIKSKLLSTISRRYCLYAIFIKKN